MAKVTITFEDDNDENTVSANIEFDPPIDNKNDEPTPAQWAAAKVFEYLHGLNGESDNG